MVNVIPLYVDNGSGPVQNPDLSPAEFAAAQQAAQARNLQALWVAAHAYESAQISGSAVGLLTLGIQKQLPKSLAVQKWIASIWALYYQRKPAVTDALHPAFLDFTSCGPMPYTVPDLTTEVGI